MYGDVVRLRSLPNFVVILLDPFTIYRVVFIFTLSTPPSPTSWSAAQAYCRKLYPRSMFGDPYSVIRFREDPNIVRFEL